MSRQNRTVPFFDPFLCPPPPTEDRSPRQVDLRVAGRHRLPPLASLGGIALQTRDRLDPSFRSLGLPGGEGDLVPLLLQTGAEVPSDEARTSRDQDLHAPSYDI